MISLRFVWRTACIGLVAGMTLSCNHLPWGHHKASSNPAPKSGEDAASGTSAAGGTSAASTEADVKAIVRGLVETASREQESGKTNLIRHRPYYYREYFVYPGGPDSAEIVLRETESRTTPRIADVKIAKTRFATRMREDKDKAMADTDFLRGTGRETLTFAYSNGHWVKTGALFVADTLEQNVGGQWAPVPPEPKATLAEGPVSKGWLGLGSVWSAITGR